MSANKKAQAEPRTRPDAIERGAVKREWNAVFSRMLIEARAQFPNDGVAAHRLAVSEADRIMRMQAAASASSRSSQEILVDQAFLEIFGGSIGGAGGRLVMVETFADRVIARGMDGKLYRVSYVAGTDGVKFGAPQLVENLADEQRR